MEPFDDTVLYPITSVLEMPNLIEQVERTTENILSEIYISTMREIREMEVNTEKLISTSEENTESVLKELTKLNTTSENTLKVATEQFKTTTAQLDRIIKIMDTMTAYQNEKLDKLIDLLGSKLKVSVEAIPTQDAIVVTNNVFHPVLNVALIPVTQ